MAEAERPGFVVAFLVRAGMIRVPARHRAWLARELVAQSARRRTASAALLVPGLTVSGTWLLLNSIGDQIVPPPWVSLAAGLAPSLVLGPFGFGYQRRSQYLRAKNEIVTEPGDGADGSTRSKPA